MIPIKLLKSFGLGGTSRGPIRQGHRRLQLVSLEDRVTPTGFIPSQIRQAYGVSSIPAFGGTVTANGAGQTIAIVDPAGDPTIQADLATFDADYGLPAPPSFKVVSQTGSTTNLPPPGGDIEESLDVEWAHAIAPGANLILVECAAFPDYASSMEIGEEWAASQNGVSVISNSWNLGFNGEENGETSLDSIFTNPRSTGSPGVAFVFAAGDSGIVQYPAASPNVLSVGGTSLYVNSDGSYASETGWNKAGGGGTSVYESRPSYQNVTVAGIAVPSVVGSHRGTPDVSMDADPNTGVYIVDTSDMLASLFVEGGTSLSCPMWAGLVAIIDQGRAQVGLQPLNTSVESQASPNLTSYQLQTDLYDLAANPTTYATDFHDITSGANNGGDEATTGYDLLTGLGSPIANSLVPDMVGYSTTSLTINTASPTAFGAIQLIATVTGKTATPTGTVEFFYGSTELGTGTLNSSGTATLTLTTSPLPAGSDTITVDYLGDANYATSNGSSTASVGTTTSSTTVTAALNPVSYGQSEIFTATVTGVSGHTPTGRVEFKYGTTDFGTYTLSGGVANVTITMVQLGLATITAYYLGDANYTTSNGSDTVTVNQAVLTVVANNLSKVYDQANPTLTYSFSGFVNGDNSSVVSGTASLSTTATTTSDVGTYPIVPTLGTLSAVNYTFAFANGTLTVDPAALTINADDDSKTYGTLKTFSDTAFTENGLLTALGDSITSVTETSTGAPVSAKVGIAAIVPSDATGTGLSNYTITYVDGTLTVNPAALTITANDDTKVYGTVKTFSSTAFTENGLVTANGDSITSVTETSTGSPVPVTLGTAPIVPSDATGTGLTNYTITYVNGTLTIIPGALIITADDDSKTYGTLKTFSDTAFTENGLVTANGDTITGVTETSTGSSVPTPAGTDPIVPSDVTGTGLSNYTAAIPGDMFSPGVSDDFVVRFRTLQWGHTSPNLPS